MINQRCGLGTYGLKHSGSLQNLLDDFHDQFHKHRKNAKSEKQRTVMNGDDSKVSSMPSGSRWTFSGSIINHNDIVVTNRTLSFTASTSQKLPEIAQTPPMTSNSSVNSNTETSKTKRNETAIIIESIQGFRGNEELDDLLKYIEDGGKNKTKPKKKKSNAKSENSKKVNKLKKSNSKDDVRSMKDPEADEVSKSAPAADVKAVQEVMLSSKKKAKKQTTLKHDGAEVQRDNDSFCETVEASNAGVEGKRFQVISRKQKKVKTDETPIPLSASQTHLHDTKPSTKSSYSSAQASSNINLASSASKNTRKVENQTPKIGSASFIDPATNDTQILSINSRKTEMENTYRKFTARNKQKMKSAASEIQKPQKSSETFNDAAPTETQTRVKKCQWFPLVNEDGAATGDFIEM